MNNQNLVIYDFKILYEILREINNYINFKLISVDKVSDLNLKDQNDYLLISNKKIKNVENQITLNNFPIDIIKLIESINVKFLKKKYSQQSDIDIGAYKINLNSRKIIALGGIAIGNIKLIGLTKSIGFAGISAFNKKKGP